jgi:hypothetical protein
MSSGLIQLICKGKESEYLTQNPQISLFKIIYRRHTNFTIEQIPLKFSTEPNFGKKVSLTLSKLGDLINTMYLVLTLPEIPKYYEVDGSTNDIVRYAWSYHIADVIIKNIELVLGDTIIDKQYGEWLHIWHSLFDTESKQYDKMTGNIEDLYNFSETKNETKIFIPLHFYFCDNIINSFPLCCFEDIKLQINLEISDLSKCLITSPTNYIDVEDPIVFFNTGDYLLQNIKDEFIIGKFIYFDENKKRLYYNKITTKTFYQDYEIYNSEFFVTPRSISHEYSLTNTVSVNLTNSYILTSYVYIEKFERDRIKNKDHNYLIKQIQYNGESTFYNDNGKVDLSFKNNVLFLCWVANFAFHHDVSNNDFFNYNSFEFNNDNFDIIESPNLIKTSNIIINGINIMSYFDDKYFMYTENINHFNKTIDGIHTYSFSLKPMLSQPSGSINMNELNNVQIEFEFNKNSKINSNILLRAYCQNYNILQISYNKFKLLF